MNRLTDAAGTAGVEETAVVEDSFPAVLRGTFGRLSPDCQPEREHALQAVLAAGGGTFAGLVAVVRDCRLARTTREDAMSFLDQLADARVTPVLLDLLADRAFDLREMAAWCLGYRGDKRAAPAMLERLKDAREEPAVRRAVGFSLGVLGATRPVPALIRLLHGDADAWVREAAAYALAFIGDRRAFEPLLHTFENADEAPVVRGQAAEALAYLGNPGAVPALIAALEDPAPEVRFWAAFALGHLAGEEAIPPLERLASDGTVVPNWWAVNAEAAEAITYVRERLQER